MFWVGEALSPLNRGFGAVFGCAFCKLGARIGLGSRKLGAPRGPSWGPPESTQNYKFCNMTVVIPMWPKSHFPIAFGLKDLMYGHALTQERPSGVTCFPPPTDWAPVAVCGALWRFVGVCSIKALLFRIELGGQRAPKATKCPSGAVPGPIWAAKAPRGPRGGTAVPSLGELGGV